MKAIALALCQLFVSSCRDRTDVPATDLNGSSVRADGSRINWRLENVRRGQPNRILLIAQGSGCAPARSSAGVEALAAEAAPLATLTVEKYGVGPLDNPSDPIESCTEEYFANHTVTQRVIDARTVLTDLKKRGLWKDALYLFGGSEGGAVVSILAHEVPETDAVVVFSTGTGLTMAEFFPMVVPPPVAKQMLKVFETARADPNAEGVMGGNSLRWWADIIDRRLSDDLLRSEAPVLIVHGENDRSAPVAAARAAQAAFLAAGEAHRLTYWELAERDHAMRAPNRQSHMDEVLRRVVGWLAAR